jgi:hypothetical protein
MSILTRVEKLEGAREPAPEGPEPTPEEVEQARQILAEVGFPEVMSYLPEMEPAEVQAWLYEGGPLPSYRRV